jgi:hypothetical protein
MTELAQLVVDSRGYMSTVAKAKTAKLSELGPMFIDMAAC